MKKLIIGVVVGVVFLVAFLYFGGPKYLKIFGTKTEEAGERLQQYEKPVKDTAKTVKKAVDKTYDKTKDKVKEIMK